MENEFPLCLYKSQKIDHFYISSTGILGQYLIWGGYDIGKSFEKDCILLLHG